MSLLDLFPAKSLCCVFFLIPDFRPYDRFPQLPPTLPWRRAPFHPRFFLLALVIQAVRVSLQPPTPGNFRWHPSARPPHFSCHPTSVPLCREEVTKKDRPSMAAFEGLFGPAVWAVLSARCLWSPDAVALLLCPSLSPAEKNSDQFWFRSGPLGWTPGGWRHLPVRRPNFARRGFSPRRAGVGDEKRYANNPPFWRPPSDLAASSPSSDFPPPFWFKIALSSQDRNYQKLWDLPPPLFPYPPPSIKFPRIRNIACISSAAFWFPAVSSKVRVCWLFLISFDFPPIHFFFLQFLSPLHRPSFSLPPPRPFLPAAIFL